MRVAIDGKYKPAILVINEKTPSPLLVLANITVVITSVVTTPIAIQ